MLIRFDQISHEPYANPSNGKLSTRFIKHYLLIPLPYARVKSTNYSDTLHDFSAIIPRRYKDVYVISFFPLSARPLNSLPIEYFRLK